MNKRLFLIFAALLIAGLLLSACQPAATEAPAEVEEPTEEVVVEEPTEEVVVEEPTEEENDAE